MCPDGFKGAWELKFWNKCILTKNSFKLVSLDNGWWKFKNCNIVALLRFSILSNCTGKGSSNLYPCTWENKLFCLFVIRLLEGGEFFQYIFHLDIYIFSELSLCAHQYYAIKSVILIITNVTNMTNVTVWQM